MLFVYFLCWQQKWKKFLHSKTKSSNSYFYFEIIYDPASHIWYYTYFADFLISFVKHDKNSSIYLCSTSCYIYKCYIIIIIHFFHEQSLVTISHMNQGCPSCKVSHYKENEPILNENIYIIMKQVFVLKGVWLRCI